MNYKVHTTAKKINSASEIVSTKNDDPNHFDPRYFGKGKKYHQPENYVIRNILNNLKKLSKSIDKLGIKIINAGYNSKVEYFPKVDFLNFLNLSEKECFELFDDSIKCKTKYKNLDELKSFTKVLNENNIIDFQPSLNYCLDLTFGK